MSDNSDSSPDTQTLPSSGVLDERKWSMDMTSVYAEVNRLRESVTEKDREILKLQRETHKLKSVIEKSELRRIPSTSQQSRSGSGGGGGSGSTSASSGGSQGTGPGQNTGGGVGGGGGGTVTYQKKCGVSGESCPWNVSSEEETTTTGAGEPQRYHKDFRSRQLIRSALADNDFLQNLDREQVRDMVDFMYPQTFSPGEFVIREGEPGCHLYVSAEGTLYVSQESRNLGTLKPGVAFGELALLYNCKRTASVRAITECKVWALERRAFRLAMVKAGMQRMRDRLAFLKSVTLFKGLDAATLGRIADCLEVEKYTQGSFIIREGTIGDSFFIICQGRVQVTTSASTSPIEPNKMYNNNRVPKVQVENCEGAGPQKLMRELGSGSYFGEQALLKQELRSANVVAVTDVEVLTLCRESFLQLIGDLDEFNLHNRKPSQSSSCSELATLCKLIRPMGHCEISYFAGEDSTWVRNPWQNSSSSEDGWGTHRSTILSKGQLSCSLPNPTLERDESFGLTVEDDEFDFSKLRLDDLEFLATLGIGGFGRVELVQVSYDPNRVFALKCLPKANISATQQQEHVYSERNIMLSCKSPFIASMFRTFKDTKYVYLLMEACLGGEVWTLLRDKGNFDNATTRFVASCVILALEYLHEKCVIYRDLKPENLMLANNGYVKLVDFGFSKVVPPSCKTWTFCGTPEYCPPEVILNKGHDYTVDFWAFGVLLFELLTGCPPWGPGAADNIAGHSGIPHELCDPLATYNSILKGIESVQFPKNYVSKGAQSLIRRLCRQVPGERLGARGFREITNHRWWQGYDWEGVRLRRMRSPVRPNLSGPSDASNFDKFELEIEDIVDDFSGWDIEF